MKEPETPLKAARVALAAQARRSLREGDGWFPEADEGLNNASRAVVAAMAATFGEAWLGECNGYRRDDWRALWRWDGGLVYNFAADFVLPRHNAGVERLLRERAAGPHTGTREAAQRIAAIFAAVDAAGGVLLYWS